MRIDELKSSRRVETAFLQEAFNRTIMFFYYIFQFFVKKRNGLLVLQALGMTECVFESLKIVVESRNTIIWSRLVDFEFGFELGEVPAGAISQHILIMAYPFNNIMIIFIKIISNHVWSYRTLSAC